MIQKDTVAMEMSTAFFLQTHFCSSLPWARNLLGTDLEKKKKKKDRAVGVSCGIEAYKKKRNRGEEKRKVKERIKDKENTNKKLHLISIVGACLFFFNLIRTSLRAMKGPVI